jgi:hypothetical protein
VKRYQIARADFSCYVYAAELKKKRDNELHDERGRVNYQEGKNRREGAGRNDNAG